MVVFSMLRPIARTTLTRRSFRFFSSEASLVDCSKVFTLRDADGSVGAYANQDIKKGDLVERGVVRRLPVDGNVCPHVFTWSTDRSVWAAGSGCSFLYNSSLTGAGNTDIKRKFEDDSFEIVATRDIEKGEEILSTYKSLEWRKCFEDLKDARDSGEALPPRMVTDFSDPMIDCSKVYAKYDAYGGVGAYAAQDIKKGELVEKGVARRLPVDGNVSPFVFTWSEDRSVWATGSGCSVFYNADLNGNENTEMIRHFDEDRFEIYAIKDIKKDEEVTHLYKSIQWRDCFKDLKKIQEAGGKPKNARELMTDYWTSEHSAPTLENMMLDSDAGTMDRLERPEILSALPSIAGKRVLELGAGIGRFSGVLAQRAQEVVAVDFVEGSCNENRRINAQHKNLEVVHADVTMLELNQESFDLVFSNWLLMYLTDDEVKEFAKRALSWLQPGGVLFFRESCFHSSGNVSRRFNPTKYRDPGQYAQMFSDAVLEDGSRFQLLATNCVETYGKIKGNVHQMWFRWQKLGPQSLKHMNTILTGQYTPAHCLRYEAIYGRSYIYTGGDKVSQLIADSAAECLKPGARVLDLGCGMGGMSLFMAENYPEVYFHAVNTSAELFSFNTARHVRQPSDIRHRVNFELLPEWGVPEGELKYPPNSFDVFILRETLMYYEVQDKAVLLQKACRLLRPGGKLIVVDYCKGKSEVSKEFADHLSTWAYECIDQQEEKQLLERYFEVESWDATEDFVKYMDEGLVRIEDKFGPQAPARQVKTNADDLEKLREPIMAQVRATLPNLPEEAALDAAQTVVDKVAMHVEAQVAEADECRANHQWAKNLWQLERKAAIDGDLSWGIFVATKTS